ncbi:ankyrin repeat-containing domain protein [Rhypophila decipiens]|uniref:Ankyrin repeat-containing domain protein n=1 Tax=Rhypophila decipiens TaxID=261697 RepID=A0AAN6Y6X7_9PEZI|nr:ankyrin repeat-containing domain protein [Rhypophila decipiens]
MPEVTCKECSRVCASAQRLSQHKRCHTKKYACLGRQCAGKNVRFGTNRDLERHQRTHKGTGEATSSTNQLCPFCNLPVGKGRQDNLARHIKRQHKDQLFIAAANGDETTVRHLLESGANVDQTSTRNETSLHLASLAGHPSVVRLLLDYGASLESTDSRGLTSLHHAMVNKHETIANLLAVRLSNPNSAKRFREKDLLSLALENGFATVIEQLLDQGADIESKSTKDDWTPLMFAASSGYAHCVRLLVQRKANTAVRCRRTGKTPLHLAVENDKLDSIEIISILLSAGANTDAKDREAGYRIHSNKTALHYAAKQGSVKKVELLLATGAEIDATDHGGRRPMFFALESKDLATVRFLLENGANKPFGDKDKNNWQSNTTLLHCAAETSSVEIVRFLLEQTNFADISSTNYFGDTPLHDARDKDIAQVLIQNGADVHSRNYNEMTPLHCARDSQIAQLLIEHGADVHSRNNNRMTPLHCAKDSQIAQLLVEHGADVSLKDNTGATPLHYSVSADIAKLLIQHGADGTSKTTAGETALHSASSSFRLDTARFWIEQPGVDINARDTTGRTPLHYAIGASSSFSDNSFILFLIQNGADPNAKDNEGETPLHRVTREYWGRGVLGARAQFLIDNGGDPNAKNNKGKTPLHVAAQNSWSSADWGVRLLLRNGADPKARDGEGRKASQIAREKGTIKSIEIADQLMSLENQTEETVLMEC